MKRFWTVILSVLVIGSWLVDARAGALRADAAKAVPPAAVSGRGFSVERRLLDTRGRYRVFALRYPSPVTTDVAANNTIPAEYYQPIGSSGAAPRPAVICLHILNGNFELVRLLCAVLADHGIPALWFKLPYYGERAPPGGRKVLLENPALFAAALDQSMADIRRTVDVLADLPEVNPAGIGICGISLGAILGASACGCEPRLARAVLILGGGDLKRILLTADETAAMRRAIEAMPADTREALLAKLEALDPLRAASALRSLGARDALLMINATDDHVVPRECTEKLARAAGIEKRVVWLEGLGHYTAMASLPRLLSMTADFFGRDMPAGLGPPPIPTRTATPVEKLAALLRDAATILGGPVKAGRCHLLDCDIHLSRKVLGGFSGRVRLVRGSGGRFALDCPVPEVGRVVAGQGDTAWLGGSKVVFVGSEEAVAGRSPLLYIAMQNMLKVRVALGAVAGLAAAPDAFSRYVNASVREVPGKGPVLDVVSLHKNARGEGVVEWAADGRTPRRILLGKHGELGEITVRQWLVDTIAPEALFQPPSGLRQKAVCQEDVCRMIAAVFDFAMEKF